MLTHHADRRASCRIRQLPRASLQGSCTSLQGSCTSLQGSCASLQGSCTSLQGSCASLQGSCASLQGREAPGRQDGRPACLGADAGKGSKGLRKAGRHQGSAGSIGDVSSQVTSSVGVARGRRHRRPCAPPPAPWERARHPGRSARCLGSWAGTVRRRPARAVSDPGTRSSGR
jgi:hypothetical protein